MSASFTPVFWAALQSPFSCDEVLSHGLVRLFSLASVHAFFSAAFGISLAALLFGTHSVGFSFTKRLSICNQCEIENIIVYGHSCTIDFEYFNYLNARYANANWTFYVVKEEQESSVLQLIKRYSIKGADIVVL